MWQLIPFKILKCYTPVHSDDKLKNVSNLLSMRIIENARVYVQYKLTKAITLEELTLINHLCKHECRCDA